MTRHAKIEELKKTRDRMIREVKTHAEEIGERQRECAHLRLQRDDAKSRLDRRAATWNDVEIAVSRAIDKMTSWGQCGKISDAVAEVRREANDGKVHPSLDERVPTVNLTLSEEIKF